MERIAKCSFMNNVPLASITSSYPCSGPISDSLSFMCSGYPWRQLLTNMLAGLVSRGDLTVSETTGISLRAQRAVELVAHTANAEAEGECVATVAQFKMTAGGELLTPVCPDAQAPGPQCVDRVTPYLVLRGMPYYLLSFDDAYRGVPVDECTVDPGNGGPLL